MSDDTIKGGDEKVITVDFKKPNIRIKGNGIGCSHYNVDVDTSERIVVCCECGSVRDPFDILEDIAYHERKIWYSLRKLNTQKKRVQELKKEEKNIKARIDRARKKL